MFIKYILFIILLLIVVIIYVYRNNILGFFSLKKNFPKNANIYLSNTNNIKKKDLLYNKKYTNKNLKQKLKKKLSLLIDNINNTIEYYLSMNNPNYKLISYLNAYKNTLKSITFNYNINTVKLHNKLKTINSDIILNYE